MSARSETYALMQELGQAGISLSFDDANTLRRAQITLHGWAEQECGNSDDWKSWAIERDDETGVPFMAIYPHQGKSRRYRIPDRENGTLRRVTDVCKRNGLHFYHQGDPRGRALYVSTTPLTDSDYDRGHAI